MTALTQRDAQLAYDRMSPPEDTEGEWLDSLAADLSDGEITNLLAEAGIDDAILGAAVYAVRNQDFGYLVRQYERQAGPVIQQAARDEAERMGDPS